MPETRNDELYRALKHNGYPDRKAWIEKKQSEEAQAAISRMYREGL